MYLDECWFGLIGLMTISFYVPSTIYSLFLMILRSDCTYRLMSRDIELSILLSFINLL
jgi:hypothetical protein